MQSAANLLIRLPCFLSIAASADALCHSPVQRVICFLEVNELNGTIDRELQNGFNFFQ